MTELIKKMTDPYERKARIYPALITLIPMVLTAYMVFPDIFKLWSSLATLLVLFGGLLFLENLARDQGKKLKGKLFEQWGGLPSVQLLRYRDKEIPTPAKKRYHELLAQQTGIQGPDEETERLDPEGADQIYRSWSDYLRGKTRNVAAFPLVFKENVNYGFRRNLWGLKPLCLCTAFLGILVLALEMLFHFQESSDFPEIVFSVLLVLIVYVGIFLFRINGNWVKTAAYAYAQQLVESLNTQH